MQYPLTKSMVGLPSAFAAACRVARSDSELFERCREVLVQRFESDQIWLTVARQGKADRVGAADGYPDAMEVCRTTTGETELVVLAAPELAGAMEPVAMTLAVGLSLVLELRSVLIERQAELDDSV